MLEPAAKEHDRPLELQRIVFRRFTEARAAGLTLIEARLFAESDADIGHLRRLIRDGCKPALIAKILI